MRPHEFALLPAPPLISIHQLLVSGADLRQAARALGRVCIEHEREIAAAARAPDNRAPLRQAQIALEAVLGAVWSGIAASRLPLSVLWQAPGVADALRLLETTRFLASYALLRGLCEQGLARWFDETTEAIWLRYGDAYPLVSRPLRDTRDALTPWMTTTHRGRLLAGTGFELWDVIDGSCPGAVLDYAPRKRLDEVFTGGPGCERHGVLPVIGMSYPVAGWHEMDVRFDRDSFFDVRPRASSEARILADLRRVRAAHLSAVPELSLSSPDALGPALARHPEHFSPIVVAGSGHETDADGARRNTCVVYLDGKPVLRHHKFHPMVVRGRNGSERREAIADGPGVIRCLCSSTTRMAVLICADLHHAKVPRLLQQLGVNLLLVPALTPHPGGFAGAMSLLASYCQGVSVVVNGSAPPDGAAAAAAFMTLAAVPTPDPFEQVVSFGPPSGGRRAVGLLDTNLPLSTADPWSAAAALD